MGEGEGGGGERGGGIKSNLDKDLTWLDFSLLI